MLKLSPLFIACLATGPFLAAQGGTSLNPVEANNEPYFLVSGQQHSVTLNDYNDAFNNPIEFSTAGSGIATNTWVWRLYPGETNDMRERRMITGIESLFLLSAATPINSQAITYAPAYVLMGAKQRGGGAAAGALDPDFSNIYIRTPELTSGSPTTVNNQLIGAGITFNTPVPLTFTGDHAIAAGYHGGEQRDKPADATTFSQSIVGSVDDGPLYDDTNNTYQPDGFAVWDPATPATPAVVTYKFYDDSRAYLTFYTDNPTVNIYSIWGKRRGAYNPPLNPPIVGLSDGTYYADIGTNQVNWGWEIWADPTIYAGGSALAFGNFGAYFNSSVPIGLGAPYGPVMAELSPFDPLLLALLGVPLPIDPTTGIADSGEIVIATTVPSMIGQYIGVECLVVTPPSATVQQATTTQARYIKIVM